MEIRHLSREERGALSATPCWYDACDTAVSRFTSDGRYMCAEHARHTRTFRRQMYAAMEARWRR